MAFKKYFLVMCGFISLVLGFLGLFLPILPTTPFVLLAAACFSRTPRLRQKVMRIKFFREHIENYEKRKGISRETLRLSLSYLWGMLLLTMFFTKQVWLLILLPLIGTGVTIHLVYMSKAKCDKSQGDQ